MPDGRGILARVDCRTDRGASKKLMSLCPPSSDAARIIAIDLATEKERVIWEESASYLQKPSPKDDHLPVYGPPETLYLVSLRDGTKRKLVTAADLEAAVFSPDGKQVALYLDGKLRVCDRDGGKMRVLYEGPHKGMKLSDMSWSPDGNWIVLTQFIFSDGRFDPPMVDVASYIAAVDVNTGRARIPKPEDIPGT